MTRYETGVVGKHIGSPGPAAFACVSAFYDPPRRVSDFHRMVILGYEANSILGDLVLIRGGRRALLPAALRPSLHHRRKERERERERERGRERGRERACSSLVRDRASCAEGGLVRRFLIQ